MNLKERLLGRKKNAPSMEPPTRNSFYNLVMDGELKAARLKPEMYGGNTEEYIRDFNLHEEFKGLPEGSIIYDLGCGNGMAVNGLSEKFPEFMFVGITPHLIPPAEPKHRLTVPIITGKAEDLSGETGDQLHKMSLFPADLILTRNSLYIPCDHGEMRAGLTGLGKEVFTGIYSALKQSGKVLIFEDSDSREFLYLLYHIIIAKARLGFVPQSVYDSNSRVQYLRLNKVH